MHLKSMQTIRSAKDDNESRAGALGLGATFSAAGAGALASLGAVQALLEVVDTSDKNADKERPHARAAAVQAVEELSRQLGSSFEPFGTTLLQKLVALYADKDRKVVDAAVRAVNTMLGQLSPLAVKLVLPALYDGMEAVQWRTKEACLEALAVLAKHAPETTGPCLPVAIPKVLECLANSNGKVQAMASFALPELCSCVENPETQKLKPMLIEAFTDPNKTLDCLDELLSTTIVNAMDSTSLAFILPVVARGLQDQKYELVKKAAVCAGNMCALVTDASVVAPFVPLLEPYLARALDHSSPDVREAALLAKQKLLDGAGDLVDELRRPRIISKAIVEALGKAAPHAPVECVRFLGDTGAELLEQRCASH